MTDEGDEAQVAVSFLAGEVADLAFVFVVLFEFVLQGHGVFFRAVGLNWGLAGFGVFRLRWMLSEKGSLRSEAELRS